MASSFLESHMYLYVPRADSAAIGSAVRKVWAEWHHHTTRVGIVKLETKRISKKGPFSLNQDPENW